MFNIIAGLAQSLAGIGSSAQARSEGEGAYDPNTGKLYNENKQKRNYWLGTQLNPLGSISDPYLTTGEKIINVIDPTLGSFVTGKKRRERMEAARAEEAAKYQEVRNKVDQLPEYQVSPEAKEKLALLQETSKDISQIGQEVTDIASRKLSGESPEATIDRKLITNNNAEMLQAIQESGAGGGAIVNAGKQTQSEYSGLSRKNLAYRMQAEQDLVSAKNNQAQLGVSGAQMKAEGLSGIISEQGKVYQSSLDKALTGIEMDITRLTGNQMQQIQNMQSSQQSNASTTSGLMQVASSYLNNLNTNK